MGWLADVFVVIVQELSKLFTGDVVFEVQVLLAFRITCAVAGDDMILDSPAYTVPKVFVTYGVLVEQITVVRAVVYKLLVIHRSTFDFDTMTLF